jgi:17beta-estradiol 17-dehydrogenase / very-long-chain 3-oxoacyl-CoA reductase
LSFARANSKRGLVLSISSGSSLQPSPLLAVYAGTKAYVNTWSESCNGEYSRLGIRFECLAPFWVTSKLSKIRKSSLTTPNPDTYVRSALGMIGNEKLHTGFFWHEVFAWMGAVMSQLGFGDSYVFNMHNAIRKRGMAKRTEKKE